MEYRHERFRREVFRADLRAGPPPGAPLPPLDLPTLTGARLRGEELAGRPALVVFASLTDPVAASAAPVLKRLHRTYGEAVRFVTVYVREAHPGERIPQPADLPAKVRNARMLRVRDGLPWTVAVDDAEGTFHRATGAGGAGAVLVDAAGRVVWSTPFSNDGAAIRRVLSAVLEGNPRATPPGRVVPMMRGLALLDEVVRTAGPSAVEAVRREAPIVFAAAELAWVWRTLTPAGRAALVAVTAAAGLALWGAARAASRPAPAPERLRVRLRH